jgi:glycerol-3-phosphate acyltransferase PlsY
VRSILVIVIAYLLGSIPFGYLIVKATRGGDIRETGSGGTGATNVSRRSGKAAGVLTLALDASKGAAAVLLAGWIVGFPILGEHIDPALQFSAVSAEAYWWVAASAVAAIVGHMFPVWLAFRGGKGVATGVGAFLVLAPVAIALCAVIFVALVVLTRYVSLGSMVAAATMPVFVWVQYWFFRPVGPLTPTVSAASAAAILIIFAHRANMRRLVEGTENKFR